MTRGTESDLERRPADAAIGVWAAQFGPGQHRFWFVPRKRWTHSELFDRAAGTLLRELGKEVMVSALYLYPVEENAARTFMLHVVPRRRKTQGGQVAEYERLCRIVLEELAHLSLEHWPPAIDYERRIPTRDLTPGQIPRVDPSVIDYDDKPRSQLGAVWAFATTFDGYEYFGVREPPGRLGEFARSVADEFRRTDRVPESARSACCGLVCSLRSGAGI